jgi:hypothetical protein
MLKHAGTPMSVGKSPATQKYGGAVVMVAGLAPTMIPRDLHIVPSDVVHIPVANAQATVPMPESGVHDVL